MVLGAIWCPYDRSAYLFDRMRDIKIKHGLAPSFEIKWSKVSPAKYAFYRDILALFFAEQDLHFRVLVAMDKQNLKHELYGQDHDTWYYKMYFELLKPVIAQDSSYRVFLDIKDTRSAAKVRKLQDVLCNSLYDFNHETVPLVQNVRSHEVELLQMADLLIGIVSYVNRSLESNPGKVALVEDMRRLSGYRLTLPTSLSEQKVNIFVWRPSEKQW